MQTKLTSSFIERFLLIAQQNSNATAICENGAVAFSYDELFAAASALARKLKESGVSREEPVGIYIEKSADYVLSLLAIWFAGAAFVPLDAKLPSERLAFILKEAGIRTIVVRSVTEEHATLEQAECLYGLQKTQLIACRVDEDAASDRAEGLPNNEIAHRSLDDLAYIIFTSGSTGEPKGVMVTQRGIVNFLDAQIQGFHFTKSSRALFFLSTNFDASVSDIGTALLSGATLYIEDESVLKPGAEFTHLLADREITHVDIPPSLLSVLDPEQMPASLETIIIGGEVCAAQVVRKWARKFRVVNVYGPTEVTVCTSFCECNSERWSRPLIRPAIANINYVVLDFELKPVLPGKYGELFISGIGLARGYLNRPELTEEKFVMIGGVRHYRTGDLVRLWEGGEIEFIGRTDRQFKLRGMLIEPEEIEARLKEHAAVHNAAVLKRGLSPESERDALVAFLSLRTGVVTDSAELRAHLSERLPRWMIPQHFEFLPSLPQTMTGKVDLAALKDLALVRDNSVERMRLNTEEAQVLCQLWKDVLSLNDVGLDEDFFDLGGDSFAVLELSVAAKARGLVLPPSMLITNTTIEQQIKALSQRRSADNALALSGGMRASQLRADVALTPYWTELIDDAARRSGSPPRVAQVIFLTGAAGFLGSRLLHDLMVSSEAQFVCLVRAADAEQGKQRIEEALRQQGLPFAQPQRVSVVCGDLCSESFALSDELWSELANQVDTIYHCAAQVNMLLPYDELRPTNVVGVQEILKFMCAGRVKALHYASTLSVFVATDQNEGVALESDDLRNTETVYGGYAQTKWAAEVFLRNCLRKIPAISFYRFGLITGDTVSGATSKSDFLALFIRGISAIGCVPPIAEELSVDITPIDFAARAFATIAVDEQCRGAFGTYHIANPVSLPLSQLIKVVEGCGIPLATVAAEEFEQQYKQLASSSIVNAKSASAAARLALCRCLSGAQTFQSFRTLDLFQATNLRFDMRKADSVLRMFSLACPPASPELIRLYVEHTVESD